MNKKKWLVLLFIVLIVSPFLVNNAYAATSEGPLKQVLGIFVQNFGFLLEEKTRTEMLSGAGPGLLYLRIMLGLLILFPLYAILSVPFKKQRGIAGAMATVIALMAVMFMPVGTIIKIGSTYSGFFVVIFYLVPLFAIFLLHRFIKSSVGNEGLLSVAEIIIGVVGFMFTSQVQGTIAELTKSYSLLGTTMDMSWFGMVYVIFAIMIIFAVLRLVRGSKSFQTNIKDKWWNPTLGGKGKDKPLGGGDGGGLPTSGGGTTTTTISDAETRLAEIKSKIDEWILRNKALLNQATIDLGNETNLAKNISDSLFNLSLAIENIGRALSEKTKYTETGAVAAEIEKVDNTIKNSGAEIQKRYTDLELAFDKLKEINDREYNEIYSSFNDFNNADLANKLKNFFASISLVKGENQRITSEISNFISGLQHNLETNTSLGNGLKTQISESITVLGNNLNTIKEKSEDITKHDSVYSKVTSDLSTTKRMLADANAMLGDIKKRVDGFKPELKNALTPLTVSLTPEVIKESSGAVRVVSEEIQRMTTKFIELSSNFEFINKITDETRILESDIPTYLVALEDIKKKMEGIRQEYLKTQQNYGSAGINIKL